MILPAWQRSLGGAIRVCCCRRGKRIRMRRSFPRRTPGKRWNGGRVAQASRLAATTAQAGSSRYLRLPDLIIVDGGKGQLSSACRELQRLGLHELPIIGLAKEFEEIYRPGRALPLQLPADSGALRLLQRIRDEAHRFANTYHQLLMKKRIGESILDDCPGVSQNRKSLLLRKFGSVQRLRKASVEEIASTEGIGQKLAEEVHRFLQRH